MLSLLYQAVQRGELTKKEADARLIYVRDLRMRLLGDRVLQSVAWKIADERGRSDTFDAGTSHVSSWRLVGAAS
jgi:hypothetical protein